MLTTFVIVLDFRYAILGFRLYEKVPPTRDNCRHLLVKLKLDGWAIGKTKVFLKYYHIEHLTKLHEKQVKGAVHLIFYCTNYTFVCCLLLLVTVHSHCSELYSALVGYEILQRSLVS